MTDQDGRTPRWEQPLGAPGEELPVEASERVDWLNAVTLHERDLAGAALFQVLVHAGVALRCRRGALEAVADQTAEDATLGSLGEGSMAVVALYLAAHAAQIACDELDNPGPIGRRRLDELVSTAEHLRDCVMHWDDKGRSDINAGIMVTNLDVLAHGPARPAARGPDTVAGITWDLFESYLDRLQRWAGHLLDERLGAGQGWSSTGADDSGSSLG